MADTTSKFESRCRGASCRSCGHKSLEPVLDLGQMPLSDGLLTREQLGKPEGVYPLHVGFCRNTR